MLKIREIYKNKEEKIKQHLQKFKILQPEKYFDEFLFCLLTPGSSARRCWQAVEELKNLQEWNKEAVSKILKKRTRFHNNKTQRILEADTAWNRIIPLLNNPNIFELRGKLAEEVNGFGLKEASHFLRNIGKSDNQIAILDRHILKNLKSLGIIKIEAIKGYNQYIETEKIFLKFAEKINIPSDHLDLLFWSQETGEMYK